MIFEQSDLEKLLSKRHELDLLINRQQELVWEKEEELEEEKQKNNYL